MNAVAVIPQYHANLPAFLKSADLFASASGLTAGISGGQPPQIAFSGKSFKLRDANGEELFVQQMTLDVIVVGNSRHVSKAYYESKYDPNNTAPPECWSDNGVAPSAQAASPQSATCAGCKWNAFGSKVSETGALIKACGDAKKLAVVLAGPTNCVINGAAQVVQPFQTVYLLKLPAMSMRPWKDYAEDIERKGWPVKAGVVIRLSFDPEVTYPKVMFGSVVLVDEALFRQFERHVESDAAKTAVGANDVPLAQQSVGPTNQLTNQQAPQPGLAQQSVPPAPACTPLQTAPAAAAPVLTTAPIPQATPEPAPTAARPRGRRPSKPSAQQPAVQAQQAQPAVTLFPQGNGSVTVGAQQNGVIQQPTASDPGLDAQLDALFANA